MGLRNEDVSIAVLQRFKEQANVLAHEKYSALHRFNLAFEAHANSYGNVSGQFPDDGLVSAFLMDFRMFYLKKNNPYNFESICSYFINEKFQAQRAQEWLDVYRKVLSEDQFRFRVGDRLLTSKMIFETILNEGHFHQEKDQKGMRLIRSSIFSEPVAKMKFFHTLTSLRTIICSFNKQIIEPYLDASRDFEAHNLLASPEK